MWTDEKAISFVWNQINLVSSFTRDVNSSKVIKHLKT